MKWLDHVLRKEDTKKQYKDKTGGIQLQISPKGQQGDSILSNLRQQAVSITKAHDWNKWVAIVEQSKSTCCINDEVETTCRDTTLIN